jgi:hypothetical protein
MDALSITNKKVPAERSGKSKANWAKVLERGQEPTELSESLPWICLTKSHALGADGSTGSRHLRSRADDSADEPRTDHVRVKFIRNLATMIRFISILSVEQGNLRWK